MSVGMKLALGCGGFLLLVLWVMRLGESPAGPTPTKAYSMAKDYVADRLKCPGSADFPARSDPGVVVINDGESCWQVLGYVDSQNSFGAKIRVRYSCRLSYIGAEKWICQDVQLYE